MSLLVGLIEVLHFVICSSSLSQFWHPKVKNKIAPKSATVWNWAGHQLAINNSIKDIKRKRTQMKKIGSIRGGHLGEHGRSFKSILFESKSFPWVFKHPSVGWSKSADGVYKKKCPMEWSLDGDAESRKTLSEMYYLRKSWCTGRICKMKA